MLEIQVNPIQTICQLATSEDREVLVMPYLVRELVKREVMTPHLLGQLPEMLQEIAWVSEYVLEEYATPIWRMSLNPSVEIRSELVGKRIHEVGVEVYTHVVCVLFSLIAIYGNGYGNYLNWLNRFVQHCDWKGVDLWGEYADEMLEATYRWA